MTLTLLINMYATHNSIKGYTTKAWYSVLVRQPQRQLAISSFPAIHKVGNVGIFVPLKFENKQNTVFGHFNFNSKYHGQQKFAQNFLHLAAVSNLFPLEVAQKCQYCQLSVGKLVLFSLQCHHYIFSENSNPKSAKLRKASTPCSSPSNNI